MPNLTQPKYSGFTFNGEHSSNYFYVNKISRPFSAPRTATLLTVPRRRGAYFQDVVESSIEIDIDVTITDDLYSYNDALDKIRTWLLTDAPAKLELGREPGRYYDAIVEIDGTLEELFNLGTFSFKFICPDGIKYTDDRKQTVNVPDAIHLNNGLQTDPVYKVISKNLFDPSGLNGDVEILSEYIDGKYRDVYKLDAVHGNIDEYENFQEKIDYAVTPGATYSISFLAKWNEFITFNLYSIDPNGNFIYYTPTWKSKPNPNPSIYQYYEFSVTIDPNCNMCRFFQWWYPPTNNTGIAYITKVQAEPGAAASSYEEPNAGIMIEDSTTNLIPSDKVNFSGWTLYKGATATVTQNYSLYNELGVRDATRITTSGGTDVTKYYYSAGTSKSGASNTVSVYVKNIGTAPVVVGNLLDTSKDVTINPGEFKYVAITSVGNGTTVYQLRFRSKNVSDALDFVAYHPQIEEKPYATTYVNGTRNETIVLPPFSFDPSQGDSVTISMKVKPNRLGSVKGLLFSDDKDAQTTIAALDSYYDSDGNPYFWTNNADGTRTRLTGNSKISANSPSVITFVFGPGTRKIYVNGVLAGSDTATAKMIRLGTLGSNGSYWLDGTMIDFHIANIELTADQILNMVNNGFALDTNTSAYFDFQYTMTAETHPTLSNHGNEETYPFFRAIVNQPVTYLSIVSPDDYIMIGNPDAVDQQPTKEYELILHDSLSTTTGWAVSDRVDDGYAIGTMKADGRGFYASDFGTKTSPLKFQGPALKKSLSQPLGDFRADILMYIYNSHHDTGMVEFYGLDSANNTVCRLYMADFWKSIMQVVGRAQIGNIYADTVKVDSNPKTAWNDFYGIMRIERRGNKWMCYFAKILQPKNYDGSVWALMDSKHIAWAQTARYTDKDGNATNQINQVQLAIRNYPGKDASTMKIFGMKVYKINNLNDPQIPYIADDGDIIEFDHKHKVIYKNGAVYMSQKDIGSNFFPIKPGDYELAVSPPEAALLDVTLKDIWK